MRRYASENVSVCPTNDGIFLFVCFSSTSRTSTWKNKYPKNLFSSKDYRSNANIYPLYLYVLSFKNLFLGGTARAHRGLKRFRWLCLRFEIHFIS